VNLSQLNQILKDRKLNKNIRHSNTISPNYVTDNRVKRQMDDDDDDDYKHKNKPKYNSLVKIEAKESNNYETSETKSLKNILNLNNNTEGSGIIAFSAPTDGSNWEFTSSLLFVTSIVTTIGYGHITPITLEGKLFCIIFSCVAIPFTLLFLSIIVSLLQNGPIKIFEKWLIKIVSKYFRISLFAIRILHLLIITLVLLILILILPALLFSYFENDWTFLDSFYYCYISLTTVGLGDFVPATSGTNASQQLYRICKYFCSLNLSINQ
jgi:potassium channel subfamily K protein 1